MFSIIDRTNMQLWPTFYTLNPNNPVIPPNNPFVNPLFPDVPTVRLNNVVGSASNVTPIVVSDVILQKATGNLPNPIVWVDVSTATSSTGTVENNLLGGAPYVWRPQPGGMVTIEPNTDNEETVCLQPNGKGGVQAEFRRNHAKGSAVIVRGNPGPWTRYDPRLDQDVVPYFSVLD
jgi:hypothetical protein